MWPIWRLAFVACVLFLLGLVTVANSMSVAQIDDLRQETEHLFYHGFDNYMKHAFPEDELRPVSCTPLARDRANPAHIELNDPLGNYSLTLVDSLSTLAILASSTGSEKRRSRALRQFQEGVAALVEQYGHGTEGAKGCGIKACGFDLDSKVQVFETVIRGVGGLLSAHLFATGELPITGYNPAELTWIDNSGLQGVRWSHNFTYNGQLLRLAENLGRRLLPAFSTSTGIPYPRVNLRHGVPFYPNSPQSCMFRGGNREKESNDGNDENHGNRNAQCPASPNPGQELTETCSAGAGSLMLEFTVLSRLTGDPVFENAAKRAFWSIWDRRSQVGLIGSGIDAETGLWTSPYTGLGAGVDSFFEYAFKTYILLSGTMQQVVDLGNDMNPFEPPPLSQEQHDPNSFLKVWNLAHSAIKHHLYRGKSYLHPHYIQADLYTGAARAYWMDSLSAFFPGLLTMAGDIDEAEEIHLLFTALWSRYSAIPERWAAGTGSIEGGLTWWGGRPEFIESTYHIYRATHDPWYLHVGEMAIRDIKRRCWTPCGWAGLQDVRTGEKSDRMESFFLGETAKYLHLLFDPDHPLNKLDAPFVFTTEGHPLIIPRLNQATAQPSSLYENQGQGQHITNEPRQTRSFSHACVQSCPHTQESMPFGVSRTATRGDLFHAANLARLHLMPTRDTIDSPIVEYSTDHPSITSSDVRSPSNYTYFPWTLPLELVPYNPVCANLESRTTFEINFPSITNILGNAGQLMRVGNGVVVNSIGGLKLGLIRDTPSARSDVVDGTNFRIQAINNIPLGKDEKVFLAKDKVASIINQRDPNFTQIRDATMLDIVVDTESPSLPEFSEAGTSIDASLPAAKQAVVDALKGSSVEAGSQVRMVLNFLSQQVNSLLLDQPQEINHQRQYITAVSPTGIGAAPMPDVVEAQGPNSAGAPQGRLLWRDVYVTGDNCAKVLPSDIPYRHQVIIMRRGGCSFSRKIANIPAFAPSSTALQLVIVVSSDNEDGRVLPPGQLIRPLLDEEQVTPSGMPRVHPISMVMVDGGDRVYDMFRKAVAVGMKRRYSIQAQGVDISNLIIL